MFNGYVIITTSMKEIRIDSKVLSSIEDYYIDFNEERGCALGIKNNVISAFFPVKNLSNEKRSFIPDFDDLNDAAHSLKKEGCEFIGIMHSHLSSKSGHSTLKPSDSDLNFYFNFVKENSGFKYLLFPIIGLENNNIVIAWFKFTENKLEEITVSVI